MSTDETREGLIAAVRTIEVGPFGPNSMAILNRGGFTRLTPSEAEQVADVVQPILAAHVAAAVAAQHDAHADECVSADQHDRVIRQRDQEPRRKTS